MAEKNAEAFLRSLHLTDNQMKTLGFNPDEDPIPLGCGTQACAFLPNEHSDVVIKFTKDSKDAVASYILMNLPGGTPRWAVPVYAVHRLPHNTYVIVSAKADPLPEELAESIDDIYNWTANDEEILDNWHEEYEDAKATLKRDDAKGYDVKYDIMALDAVNSAVTAFQKLGLDWADFHSGNWMIYAGLPVVVDFGMSKELLEPPVDELNEAATLFRTMSIKQIPVLKF